MWSRFTMASSGATWISITSPRFCAKQLLLRREMLHSSVAVRRVSMFLLERPNVLNSLQCSFKRSIKVWMASIDVRMQRNCIVADVACLIQWSAVLNLTDNLIWIYKVSLHKFWKWSNNLHQRPTHSDRQTTAGGLSIACLFRIYSHAWVQRWLSWVLIIE